MITLRAKPTASNRTKNRIREHGPTFVFVSREDFQGADSILVRAFKPGDSVRVDPKDNWLGWLPIAEIEEI